MPHIRMLSIKAQGIKTGNMKQVEHSIRYRQAHSTSRQQQTGALLMVMAVMLSVVLLGVWLTMMHPKQWQALRTEHTQQGLAQAKQALLAYATQSLGTTPCQLNCPRPGDLPCPDLNNDGVAESSCTSASARLGRLPWKTLGLGDIRDASGERYWYSLSNRYKNNPRVLPLNVDSAGEISLKQAGFLADATQGNGVVAVVIAPMFPLQLEDGVQQTRDDTTINQPSAYLDKLADEDNAQFVDASTNGFVAGASGANFNDVLLAISARDMHTAMQAQVLGNIKQAIRDCGIECSAKSWWRLASPQDVSCLGFGSLPNGACSPADVSLGRLPVSSAMTQNKSNLAFLFEGSAQHRWFQQNGWRELVFAQLGAQSVTITVAGEMNQGQQRNTVEQKTQSNQYLSDTQGQPFTTNNMQWTYTLK